MPIGKLALLLSLPPTVWWTTGRLLRRRCGCAAPGRVALLAAGVALLVNLAMLAAPLATVETAPPEDTPVSMVDIGALPVPLASWDQLGARGLAIAEAFPLWPILASDLLIVAAAVDTRCRIIPNVVTLSGLAAGLLLASLDGELGSALAGGSIGFAAFIVLYVLRPGALGFGDVKLAAFIGVATRLQGVSVALPAGILIGCLYGVVLLLARRTTWKGTVAYGPPLALGGIVGLWCAAASVGI